MGFKIYWCLAGLCVITGKFTIKFRERLVFNHHHEFNPNLAYAKRAPSLTLRHTMLSPATRVKISQLVNKMCSQKLVNKL